MPADHDVFDSGGDGVAQVQLAGDVGRRHRNHEWFLLAFGQAQGKLGLWLEVALRLPPGVEALLYGLGVVGFGQIVVMGFHRRLLLQNYRGNKGNMGNR